MAKQLPFSLLLLPLLVLFLLLHSTTSYAQSPAQSPAPSSRTNITAILEKAGQFTTLIRLMKSTQVADQINTQLGSSSSNQGLTIFAPTDNAFSNLKAGTLNSLTDQQKVQLVQFHILPNAISMSQFQTVSNPLRTQAGSGDDGQFPLNVTSSGNQVNVTTGVVSATVANTIYSDKQLAVYQVDQVLLPLAMFGSSKVAAPAPAPAPELEKGGSAAGSKGSTGDGDSGSVDTSGTRKGNCYATKMMYFGVGVAAAASLWI